jgi:hypothetical protein
MPRQYFYPHILGQTPQKNNPADSGVVFRIFERDDYILISTSTPDGNDSVVKASMVWADGSTMSTKRLWTRISYWSRASLWTKVDLLTV